MNLSRMSMPRLHTQFWNGLVVLKTLEICFDSSPSKCAPIYLIQFQVEFHSRAHPPPRNSLIVCLSVGAGFSSSETIIHRLFSWYEVGTFPSFVTEGKRSKPFGRNEQTLVEELPALAREVARVEKVRIYAGLYSESFHNLLLIHLLATIQGNCMISYRKFVFSFILFPLFPLFSPTFWGLHCHLFDLLECHCPTNFWSFWLWWF